jgi:estrogen-related receptor beta like 1
VLLALATRALQVKKFPWRKPKFEIPTQTNEATDEPVQEDGGVSSDSDPEVASEEEPEDQGNEGGFN